ncbi:hypothetical protein BJV74DRAFT_890125 [Russula compacta]|nr:hypothetical protein BJV74DRAFT_890125 [Russula compacta]
MASLSSDEGVEEQTDQISDLDFAQPIDTEGATESKDEPKDAPPAKKAKLSKQQIRIVIEDAHKELASGRGKDVIRVEDIHPDWIIEESKKAKSRVMNDNLPPGTHDEDWFQHMFIPTLVWWFACWQDPFKVDDRELLCALSIAITIINTFFTSNEVADIFTTDESRQDFAMNALEGLKFLYGNTSSADPDEWADLFHGAFVLQTFAAHMNAISGSVKVSALGNPREPSQIPSAGLGISVVVVEQALTL